MGTIQKWLVSSVLANLLRHALTALSAFLIAQGIDAQLAGTFTESLGQIVLQLLPVLIALVWSLTATKILKAAPPMK